MAWWPLAAVVAASALAAGVFVLVREADWTQGLVDAVDQRDPDPVTESSIASGRALYREYCAACHGDRGRGNGPSAVNLDPPPADLALHVPQHTDGELFYMISRGMPNSAMPAWRPALTDRERWEIVHFLRDLAAGVP